MFENRLQVRKSSACQLTYTLALDILSAHSEGEEFGNV